ncbi:TcdA/TcdB catalytic glycosyltransferase domain-containing protein [Pseudomonas chlororaphis subsp. piscium]
MHIHNAPVLSQQSVSSTSGVDAAQAPKAFSEVYPKSEFKTVPSNIHMVWVGSQPGGDQEKYLRQWAEKNPGSTVMLWVDSQQFDAYAINKTARQEAEKVFPDYQAEKPLRGLFSQLKTTLGNTDALLNLGAQKQALSELNKELSAKGNESWKEKLLSGAAKVTPQNAGQVLAAFQQLTRGNDDKFLQAECVILDQTVKSWDRCASNPQRDTAKLSALQEKFGDVKNIEIRDLSNRSDIQLKNKDAYQHEIIGRNGAYPAASDIARYEILHEHGGVYADIDLECMQPLNGVLQAHPNLMLVGLAEGKNEASGSATPYFANALLASHPGSQMLADFIDKIGEDYQTLKGNEFRGDRYFSRPNKSTIEATGPNGLRGHVDTVVRQAQEQPHLMRNDVLSLSERIWDKGQQQNQDFWSSMESHFKFPDDYVNFETEEQQKSATKAMGGVAPSTASASLEGTTVKKSEGAAGIGAPLRPGTVVSTEQVAALILEKINEKQQPGKPMIIFIAGPSASGKSVLTGALQEKALQFESVKTDHFLKSFSELSAIPANQGLPVADWPVVHGHADSFNRQLTEQLLEALSAGREFSYPLPSTYREGVMIGGFPRGERDASGPHKQVQVPVSETYLIEGISTPHLVKDATHVLVRLDCEFDETVKRRAGRGHDASIPTQVRIAEDKRQYETFQQAMNQLGESVTADIHLDSSGMTAGHFRLF